MPRPRQCRRVAGLPQVTYYKPRGVPLAVLQCVDLTVDEFEALRLADVEHLHQEAAAGRMNVSRQTFGRILETARTKVADALVHGKALSIEGGPIEVASPGAALSGQGPCPPLGPGRCCRRRRRRHAPPGPPAQDLDR
jgi:predicted DNA-binding protein (UPF0251 family)